MTTLQDLRVLVAEIGGEAVDVAAYCKGSQDPHFLEAKPSYMVKTSRADLVVAVGLGLETAWLPKVLSGARNPKVMPGQPGYLEVGSLVAVLDKPAATVTRADGDVHPEGNPHFTLDPVRMASVAQGIAAKLAQLDPARAPLFLQRARALEQRLQEKTQNWQERILASGIKQVVTYHKTLSYFLARFNLESVATLEPLPGVPPTAQHILEVIKSAKAQGVRLILVENYFDDTVARRVARELKGVRVASVPVAVEGEQAIKTVDELYERLVRSIEGKDS